MGNGFIQIYRKRVMELGVKSNKLNAYIDLEMRRNWKTGKVAYSILGIADRWGWSRGKARRFLKWFESFQNGHQTVHPTDMQEPTPATDPEGQRTPDSTPDGHISKKEELRKKNTTTPLTPLHGFEEFWGKHPKKVGKLDAIKAWNRLAPDEELQIKILAAIDQHKKSRQWRRDGGQFIQAPAAWLNKQRWEDVLEVEVKRDVNESEPQAKPTICETCHQPLKYCGLHQGGIFYRHAGDEVIPECEGPDMKGRSWSAKALEYFSKNQQERGQRST